MSVINFPFMYVGDPTRGRPLFSGQIYVGEPDLDPVTNPKQLNVIQEDGTVVPVSQPFVLSAGGYPTYNGKAVRLDVDGNYSIKVLDKNGGQQYYVESAYEGEPVTDISLVSLQENDLSLEYDFSVVASMTASAIEFPAGKILITKGYNTENDGGQAKYIVKTALQASTDGDIVDGRGNHELSDGKVAVLQLVNGEVNAKQFGAIGDGTTSDDAALNAMFEWGNSLSDGEYFQAVLPKSAGEYIFENVQVYSKTIFKGDGGVLKLADNIVTDKDTAYYLIHNLGEDRVIYDGLIIDGNVDGGNDAIKIAGLAGNSIAGVADNLTCTGFRSKVRNCTLFNAPDSSIMFSDVIRGSCTDNTIEGAQDVGIYFNASEGSSSLNSIVARNNIKSCRLGGIALKRECNSVIVTNNVISECGNGITHEDFGTGGGGHPYEVTITNNLLEDIGYPFRGVNVAEAGMSINRLTDSVISGNTIRRCSGNLMTMAGCTDSSITGNFLSGYPASPSANNNGIFVLQRVDPVTATTTESSNMVIGNNIIRDIDDIGIYVTSVSEDINIDSNNIMPTNSGIKVDASAVDITIRGNTIDAGNGADLELYPDAIVVAADNLLKSYTGAARYGYRQISSGQPLPNAGTLVPRYEGEDVIHLAGPTWWKAVGTGTAEFIQIG